jgi:hypothetical protein
MNPSHLERVCAVIPPAIAERIHEHFGELDGNGCVPPTYFKKFWHRFEKDPDFYARMIDQARELEIAVFDIDSPSWGDWPEDLEECAGLGIILGIFLEVYVEAVLPEVPEHVLARAEAACRAQSKSLEDVLVDWLIEGKANAVSDSADWWKGASE